MRVAWGGGCLTAGDLDLPAHHGLLVVNAGNGTVPVEHASFAIMLKWPPIMGILGALRVLSGTSRNDLAELTINGVRAAWFPMLGAGRYVARAVAACSGSCRSTPTTGHGWLLSGYRSGRRV